jgi:hypothetical protein
MTDEEREIWDVNPLKVQVELSEGNLKISESAVYNGRVRVAEAMDTRTGPQECAWLYVTAESRDGADITLTKQEAVELRDALTECIEAKQ